MKADRAGDLPFFYHLFGRRTVTRNETELIILVTPELVHALDPEEVPPLPGFDVTEPSHDEFYYRGQLEGRPTHEHRSTVWPILRKRYQNGGPAMMSGPFGHGQ
jgi:pilus assembly protein CpaC